MGTLDKGYRRMDDRAGDGEQDYWANRRASGMISLQEPSTNPVRCTGLQRPGSAIMRRTRISVLCAAVLAAVPAGAGAGTGGGRRRAPPPPTSLPPPPPRPRRRPPRGGGGGGEPLRPCSLRSS